MKRIMRWVEPLPKMLRVRISEKMEQRIQALAKRQKCSFSDAARIVLTNGLARGDKQ